MTTHDVNAPPYVTVFLDETARAWEVREIRQPILQETRATFLRPEYADGWLLFTSEGEHRRLAPRPPGWQLASEELMRRWCREAKVSHHVS